MHLPEACLRLHLRLCLHLRLYLRSTITSHIACLESCQSNHEERRDWFIPAVKICMDKVGGGDRGIDRAVGLTVSEWNSVIIVTVTEQSKSKTKAEVEAAVRQRWRWRQRHGDRVCTSSLWSLNFYEKLFKNTAVLPILFSTPEASVQCEQKIVRAIISCTCLEAFRVLRRRRSAQRSRGGPFVVTFPVTERVIDLRNVLGAWAGIADAWTNVYEVVEGAYDAEPAARSSLTPGDRHKRPRHVTDPQQVHGELGLFTTGLTAGGRAERKPAEEYDVVAVQHAACGEAGPPRCKDHVCLVRQLGVGYPQAGGMSGPVETREDGSVKDYDRYYASVATVLALAAATKICASVWRESGGRIELEFKQYQACGHEPKVCEPALCRDSITFVFRKLGTGYLKRLSTC
ncbi:hypothetical protein C8R45DRAFT_925431 [Mycena sanguinolenta]|nr:hypothetical protein C8R45DRAFT_925431 [Mycena sanguinolenta]